MHSSPLRIRNPRFLSLLPTPLLSIASHQLAGRGRGSNIWLSPSGCLQFSLLLRVSLSTLPAHKIVFLQYLFGLAVTEACREDMVLGHWGKGVRLKWPNDVYVVVGDGYGGDDQKKVGGILINTSFQGDSVDIIIGTSNPFCVSTRQNVLTVECRLRIEFTQSSSHSFIVTAIHISGSIAAHGNHSCIHHG
jgi:biotin--protein ligase